MYRSSRSSPTSCLDSFFPPNSLPTTLLPPLRSVSIPRRALFGTRCNRVACSSGEYDSRSYGFLSLINYRIARGNVAIRKGLFSRFIRPRSPPFCSRQRRVASRRVATTENGAANYKGATVLNKRDTFVNYCWCNAGALLTERRAGLRGCSSILAFRVPLITRTTQGDAPRLRSCKSGNGSGRL